MLNKPPLKYENPYKSTMLRMLRDCYGLRNKKTPYKSKMLRMLRLLRDFLGNSTLHSVVGGWLRDR